MGCGLLALELGYDAPAGDALLYLAYEAGFVVLPGWLAYRALSARPGSVLRQLAMGWGLGYVLEILAFMATAAIGARGLFYAYPAVVAAAAVAAGALRRPDEAAGEEGSDAVRSAGVPPRPDEAAVAAGSVAVRSAGAERSSGVGFAWLVAAVCLLAALYVALAYFPGSPLPGTTAVTYFPDYPRWIAIAAEAKHHWPIMEPSVAGEPLPYHYFVNIHFAAASQVTGIGLPLIYFRLFILPLMVLAVLEIVVAGQSLSRSAKVGLAAAVLAFFVSQLRLDARQTFLAHNPFFGFFFTYVFRSPSFLLGLVIFVPLIVLLGERLATRGRALWSREWLLVVLFAIGASDAKIALLPLIFVALGLYVAWAWATERRLPPAAVPALAVTALVAATVWVLQYRGHTSRLGPELFAGFDEMTGVVIVKNGLRDALPAIPAKESVVSTLGVLVGLIGLLAAQLAGLVWLARRQGRRLRPGQAWLLALLCAGLIGTLTLGEPDTENQFYFFAYGIVAGCLLSAEGLALAWRSRPPLAGRTRGLAVLGFAWAAALAALMWLPLELDLFTGRSADGYLYLFWYACLLALVVLLYVGARLLVHPSRWPAVALACAAVVTVGALDTPIDSLYGAVRGNVKMLPGKRLTPALYGALAWIRDNTPTDAVIAVNNQWVDATNIVPLAYEYSAFSERRVFLEGWLYSQRYLDEVPSKTAGKPFNPFPERLALNEAAFTRGNPFALAIMERRYGVRYLLVDAVNGYPADLAALARVARPVYRAPGATVLVLRPGAGFD